METMPRPVPTTTLAGVEIFEGYLDRDTQEALVSDLRDVVAQAPLFAPKTRFGKEMSVRMTSAGRYGWFTDARGYRYIDAHPSGTSWPPIPERILGIWRALASKEREPDCCLINFYGEAAKMGLHQDRDEADFGWPVLSISLGDEALFRVGGTERGGKTRSIWLRSGDVVVMGGAARLVYHGIDRIKFGTSPLLSQGGRINLTLRVVD